VISRKDISIVIQGPISEISLNNLDYYAQFAEVIISTWADKPFGFDVSKYDNIKILANALPKIEKQHNIANVYLQCLSTFNGLDLCTSKFSIKTRSDECFSNFDALITELQENKIVTTNIFFGKDVNYKYHPSDHLIFSETLTLKDIYKKCISACENIEKLNVKRIGEKLIAYDSNKDGIEIKPESILGKIACESILNKEALAKESVENMKKCFNIVPLYKLGNFKFSSNSSNHNKSQPYLKGISEDWFSNNPSHPNSINEI